MCYKLKSTCDATLIRDLLRAFNSNKELFLFKIHAFNVGSRIDIVCTDTFKDFGNKWNGYDFYVYNDEDTKGVIAKSLVDRVEACNINQRKRVLKIKKYYGLE
jgi:hypothetical protein